MQIGAFMAPGPLPYRATLSYDDVTLRTILGGLHRH